MDRRSIGGWSMDRGMIDMLGNIGIYRLPSIYPSWQRYLSELFEVWL